MGKRIYIIVALIAALGTVASSATAELHRADMHHGARTLSMRAMRAAATQYAKEDDPVSIRVFSCSRRGDAVHCRVTETGVRTLVFDNGQQIVGDLSYPLDGRRDGRCVALSTLMFGPATICQLRM